MTPLKALKAAVAAFEERKCRYCLIGGHAASLYRINERVTKDVDFALVAAVEKESRKQAEEIIKALGLRPTVGFIPGIKNRPGRISLITSAPQAGALTGIIDILLPEQPWVVGAIERAQYNRLDLVFAKVPVITPEDLVIAKAFALQGAPDRFQDLDDIKEIFLALPTIDTEYIRGRLQEFEVRLPKILRASVPAKLKKFCK